MNAFTYLESLHNRLTPKINYIFAQNLDYWLRIQSSFKTEDMFARNQSYD